MAEIFDEEKELLVHDSHTGLYARMTMSEIKRAQQELDRQLNQRGCLSFKNVMDILMEDWTEEQKLEFQQRQLDGGGWDCSLNYGSKKRDVTLLKVFDGDKEIITINW